MKKNTKRDGRNASRIEDLESRQLMAAHFDTGMNINVNSSDVREKGVPVMKALGVDSVRVFISPEFDKRNFEGALTRAIEYSAAGFDVMLIVNPEDGKVYSQSQVKGWFEWATSNTALKNAVDRWQVGNEVDSNHYWKGSLSSYVSNFLKPASEAIRAAGESVVSASVSWNPEDVRTMINAGMLNYSDFVGYHPYANGLSALKTRVAQINSIVAGRKPIVASEWNVRGYENNKTAWAAAVKDAYPVIRAGFDINYYFALLNTTATPAGPGGIMNANGSKTSFYSALANGKGGDDGNDPSALPSVAKISVYNADTGLLLVDSLTSGGVIDLSRTTTRNLSFVAVTAAGTSSVKFTLDGSTSTDNTATFELVKNVYAGSYTLTATPYAADNAAGTKGSTRTFSFTVKNAPTTVGTPAPSPGTSNGSISGFAFNDKDYDGVWDKNETKTSGKTVFLDTNNNGKLDAGEKSVVTNSSGAYSFTGLSAGTYAVRRVFPDGYTYSNTPVSVTLTSGKAATDANLGSKPTNVATPTPTPTVPPISGTKPTVSSMSLVDAKTGKALPGYENITGSKWIKLTSLPTRNIKVVVNANSATSSVKVMANGKTRVDNAANFESDAFYAWGGTYQFTGTPYAGDNASGTAGNRVLVTIKFY